MFEHACELKLYHKNELTRGKETASGRMLKFKACGCNQIPENVGKKNVRKQKWNRFKGHIQRCAQISIEIGANNQKFICARR